MARFAPDNDIRIYQSNGSAARMAEETRVLSIEAYVLPDEPEITDDTILFRAVAPETKKKTAVNPILAVTVLASLFVLLLVMFSSAWLLQARCAAEERTLRSLESQNAAFALLTDQPGRAIITTAEEQNTSSINGLLSGLLRSCEPYTIHAIPTEK